MISFFVKSPPSSRRKREQKKTEGEKRTDILFNLFFNVLIPSFIMIKLSSRDYLGETYGLILALLFPLTYGLHDWRSNKNINFFSSLGIISILITGVIGLAELDRKWMIAKETGIPLIFGLVVLFAQLMNRSVMYLFFDQVLDLEKVKLGFILHDDRKTFKKLMAYSSYMIAGTFFLSAVLNFFLAIFVLRGEPGTVEFTESLGRMTALSFPIIAIPTTIMLMGIVLYMLRTILKKTDLSMEKIIKR